MDRPLALSWLPISKVENAVKEMKRKVYSRRHFLVFAICSTNLISIQSSESPVFLGFMPFFWLRIDFLDFFFSNAKCYVPITDRYTVRRI